MNDAKRKLLALSFLLGLLFAPVGLARYVETTSEYSLAFVSFARNLRYGLENSTDVTKLQRYLTDEKLYSGPITGNYFSRTTKAVKSLQRFFGIAETGEFDTRTRERTNEFNEARETAEGEASSSADGDEPALVSFLDFQQPVVTAAESGQAFSIVDDIITIDAERSITAPSTWNAHLPKMVVGPVWSYAVFSRFQADVNNRVAWVYKKRTGESSWVFTGRFFNYLHQLPGIVMDTRGDVHIVFDCMPQNHECSGGGVTAQDNTRYYHLVFNGRNSDGSVDFVHSFLNSNEWVQESYGYMNIAVNPASGTVLGSLATNADFNNHVFSLGVSAPRFDFVPKLDTTSKLAYLQFAISPNGTTYVAVNELRRDWKSSAEYTGIAVYRYSGGAFQKVFSDTVPAADGVSSFIFGSDMSFNQQGRLYALYHKSPSVGNDCNYLMKEGLDGIFTSTRLSLGCLGSYPQLQIDSDNVLRVLGAHKKKLVIFSSDDDGITWDKRSLALSRLVTDTTQLAYPTLIKPWSSPLGYTPDVLRGYYAGLDDSNASWYAGSFCIPLRDSGTCSSASGRSSIQQSTTTSAATPVVPPATTVPTTGSVSAPASTLAPATPSTFTSTSGVITLSASPSTISSGEFSTLSLSAPGVAFCTIAGGAYGAGQQTQVPTWSGWTGILTQDTSFTARCTGSGGESYAASLKITVTPLLQGVTTVSLPSLSLSAASTVAVSWSTPIETTPKDWVAFVPQGEDWTQGYGWGYTGGAKSGSRELPVPAIPGTYDLVYYRNDTQNEAGRLASVHVAPFSGSVALSPGRTFLSSQTQEAINLMWWAQDGVVKDGDWIALVPKGQAWSEPYPWFFVNGRQHGIVQVSISSTRGQQFELVYCHRGPEEVGRSQAVLTAQ